MNPHTRITSLPASTPPQSGDRYLHPKLGPVRLIRPSGGNSFWCLTQDNKRISLNPNRMKPLPPE